MPAPTSALAAWLSVGKGTDPLVELVEIEINSSTRVYFVNGRPDGNASVSFDGNTYIARSFEVEGVSENVQNNAAQGSLTLSNADGAAAAFIENNVLEGNEVIVSRIPLSLLGTPAEAFRWYYQIGEQTYNASSVSLVLGTSSYLSLAVPWKRYERFKCQHNWENHHDPASPCGMLSDRFGPNKKQNFLSADDVGLGVKVHQHGWRTINRGKATDFDVDTATLLNLRIANGDTEEPADWFDGARDGPFCYKLVGGAASGGSDFDVWLGMKPWTEENVIPGLLVQSDLTPGFWYFTGWERVTADPNVKQPRTYITDNDSTTTEVTTPSAWANANRWVRITRVGDVFSAYQSDRSPLASNFAGWTKRTLGASDITLAMGVTVRVGVVLIRRPAASGAKAIDYEQFQFLSGGPLLCEQTPDFCEINQDNFINFGANPGTPL